MRPAWLGLVLMCALGCAEDPLVGPAPSQALTPRPLTRVWFTGSPENSTALAHIDAVVARDGPRLLLIVDGTIVRESAIPEDLRAQVVSAESVRTTACPYYGECKDVTVLIVKTASASREVAR